MMNKLLIVTTVTAALRAFFAPIARQLRSQGWRVDGMAQGASSCAECLQAFDRVWDIELSRNPLAPANVLVAPRKIREICAQEQYDLVQVSTPVAAFVTRYALKDLRQQHSVKIIYTAQGFHFYEGGSPLKNTIFLSLEKLAGQWTDYLVVVNREDENAALHHQIVPADRILRIPGTGMNVDRFDPATIAQADILRVRQELKLPPEASLFLSVAEFIPRKHPEVILKAFARLPRSTAHLAFAGTGTLLDKMQRLAVELKIQDRVHFLGFRRDVPVLMRAAIATILASEQEGLPNCVMESLCLGVPAIGTDIRGTRDLIADGNGLLFNVGDVEALTKAMAWMLAHPEQAQAMGSRGRSSVAAYGFRPILQSYEALYAKAMGLSEPILV